LNQHLENVARLDPVTEFRKLDFDIHIAVMPAASVELEKMENQRPSAARGLGDT